MNEKENSVSLYVATNLDHFESDESELLGTDFTIVVDEKPKTYRKLDSRYYAWLRDQYNKATKKLPEHIAIVLEHKFFRVTEWIMNKHGKDAPEKSKLTKGYKPSAYTTTKSSDDEIRYDSKIYDNSFKFPKDGNYPFLTPVLHTSLKKVRAIEQSALEFGWTLDLLYRNRNKNKFPMISDEASYGLVTFIKDTTHIGKITNDSIEIVENHSGNTMRFPHPNGEIEMAKKTIREPFTV